jgi:hypothetical protein
MGYKEDIRIDIHALDAEWIKQASLYQYYAKKEAIALYERDQLADRLALVQAQLDKDIRLDPKKYGFESKPTEAAILNSIKQDPFYTKANELLMRASCKAKIIGGAVRAFDHKKKALEKLTELYLSGYWAAPKIKSEAQEVYGKQTREDVEAALKKDDRMIAAALKKGAGKATEPKSDAIDRKRVNATAGESTIGKKAGGRTGKKTEKKAANAAGKTAGAKTGKEKGKGKTKPESKPIGRTKEELLKQSRQTPSPKSPGKKKK